MILERTHQIANPIIPPTTFNKISSTSKTRPINNCVVSMVLEINKLSNRIEYGFFNFKKYQTKNPNGININILPNTLRINKEDAKR